MIILKKYFIIILLEWDRVEREEEDQLKSLINDIS
jgi:hypothetical protein